MSWFNADGLLVKFGQEPGVSGSTWGNAAEYMDVTDGLHVVEVILNPMTALLTTPSIISDTVTIPSGARIESVTTITATAATSGGAAALNVGLIDQDRTTAFDADGFVAAAALTTIDLAGETTAYTTASGAGGALIGTTLTNTGLIVADYDTAVYTAGSIIVRIKYRFPYVTQ